MPADRENGAVQVLRSLLVMILVALATGAGAVATPLPVSGEWGNRIIRTRDGVLVISLDGASLGVSRGVFLSYAGPLSSGQRYLVCTTTADSGGRRSPLTIAVSRPGDGTFNHVFRIRDSVSPATPGVSDPRADFSDPYAVEHAGRRFIGYTHKSHAANELAIIPVASLRPDPPAAR